MWGNAILRHEECERTPRLKARLADFLIRPARRTLQYMSSLQALQELPQEQRALLLDVGQIVLDVVGVIEPTPFADLTNAVISLTRADHVGAAVRALGVIPYVGDLAKLANLPRYAKVVEQAIALASADARFARLARPLLNKLVHAIDCIPARVLSQHSMVQLERVRESIVLFLGGSRVLTRVERLVNQVLEKAVGSARNVGALPRRNVRFLIEYCIRHGVIVGDDLTQAFKIANGIDFHAVEALRVVHFKTGDRFWQYADAVAETLPQNASKLVMQTGVHQAMLIGQWFVRARGAVSEANLGLSASGRELREFVLSRDAEVLVSKSAATLDGWTTKRAMQVASPRVTGAMARVKNAEFAAGGGEQMFIPRAWETVKAVARPGK